MSQSETTYTLYEKRNPTVLQSSSSYTSSPSLRAENFQPHELIKDGVKRALDANPALTEYLQKHMLESDGRGDGTDDAWTAESRETIPKEQLLFKPTKTKKKSIIIKQKPIDVKAIKKSATTGRVSIPKRYSSNKSITSAISATTSAITTTKSITRQASGQVIRQTTRQPTRTSKTSTGNRENWQKIVVPRALQSLENPTLPEHLQKYDYLPIPNDMKLANKLFRPNVVINLEVKKLCLIGSFEFELYTEAVPQVVIEFVRACAVRDKSKIQIARLIKEHFMECKLNLDPNSPIIRHRLEYDELFLQKIVRFGELSIAESRLNGVQNPQLNFSINFKALNCLEGERLVFGRIVKGRHIFEELSCFGTENGKPIREIIVRDLRFVNKK